jgi:hypothetical protein
MPLRKWVAYDVQETTTKLDRCNQEKHQKASTLRKVTISYAIAKLLQHLSLNVQIKNYSSCELERLCSIDNFMIRLSTEQSDPGWEVMGVDMVNPQMKLHILTGVQLSYNFFDTVNDEEFTGRTITPSIISPYVKPDSTGDSRTTNDESMLCHFFGLLLHRLFACEDVAGIKPQALQKVEDTYEGKPLSKKKSSATFSQATSISGSDSVQANFLRPLSIIGYSSSLSQVVTNLVDCGLGLARSSDSYPSLEMAIVDICYLLQEPGRFLFEDFRLSPKEGLISRRLYGRTAEARLITDAFCRVASTGESEAFLISGFSGYVSYDIAFYSLII